MCCCHLSQTCHTLSSGHWLQVQFVTLSPFCGSKLFKTVTSTLHKLKVTLKSLWADAAYKFKGQTLQLVKINTMMYLISLCLLCHSGTLWNTKASLPAARQAQTLNAVVATLSQCLGLDAGTLIPELRRAEEARHRKAPAVTDVEDQAAGELAVEEMNEEEEAPKQKRNGKSVKADNDFSDLLPVS